jgi:hypothetical protein
MSNVEWDSKTVIGQKAKAPKVAKNSADLNGVSRHAMTACRSETHHPPPYFSFVSCEFIFSE